MWNILLKVWGDEWLVLLFHYADFQEPYAVVVLLEKDLVVIDLAQNGWAWLLNKYSLSWLLFLLNEGYNGTINLIIFYNYYLYVYAA